MSRGVGLIGWSPLDQHCHAAPGRLARPKVTDWGCKVPLCQAVLSCRLPFALSSDHQIAALSARGRTRNSFRNAEEWRLALPLAPGASSIPEPFLARSPMGAGSPRRQTATLSSIPSPRVDQYTCQVACRVVFSSAVLISTLRGLEDVGARPVGHRYVSTFLGFFDRCSGWV